MAQAEIEKPRGQILDRNMIPFTNRAKKTSIVLMPLVLRKSNSGLINICRILGFDYNEIYKRG
jgi:peptidoglycan glycosyltransferase/penicillin-binding protein 2